jgi:hypothetical protein
MALSKISNSLRNLSRQILRLIGWYTYQWETTYGLCSCCCCGKKIQSDLGDSSPVKNSPEARLRVVRRRCSDGGPNLSPCGPVLLNRNPSPAEVNTPLLRRDPEGIRHKLKKPDIQDTPFIRDLRKDIRKAAIDFSNDSRDHEEKTKIWRRKATSAEEKVTEAQGREGDREQITKEVTEFKKGRDDANASVEWERKATAHAKEKADY